MTKNEEDKETRQSPRPSAPKPESDPELSQVFRKDESGGQRDDTKSGTTKMVE